MQKIKIDKAKEEERLVDLFLQAFTKELRDLRKVWAESIASLIVYQGMSLSSLVRYVDDLQEKFADDYQAHIQVFVTNYFRNKGWSEEEEFKEVCLHALNEAMRQKMKEIIQ